VNRSVVPFRTTDTVRYSDHSNRQYKTALMGTSSCYSHYSTLYEYTIENNSCPRTWRIYLFVNNILRFHHHVQASWWRSSAMNSVSLCNHSPSKVPKYFPHYTFFDKFPFTRRNVDGRWERRTATDKRGRFISCSKDFKAIYSLDNMFVRSVWLPAPVCYW